MSKVEKDIFDKFRSCLPESISDSAIEFMVKESVKRTKEILGNHPSCLLEEDMKIEILEEWDGDIHLHGGGQFGISWIFNKKTGELHTT